MIKEFLMDEEGMGTAEVVVISAVLITVALIFKNTIYEIVKKVTEGTLNKGNVDLKFPES